MKRALSLNACGVILLLILTGCNRSPEARRDKYMARGKAFLEKQDFSRAILEFKNAARVDPDNAEVYYQIGVAYRGAHDPYSTMKAFQKAIDLNPKHVQAQLGIALQLALTDDKELLKDAQNRLKTLLEGAQADTEVLNTLAFTELKLGNSEDAMEILTRALKESPGDLSSAVLLSQAKLSQKDAKSAEAVLLKACQDAPKSAGAHRYLAEFYIYAGRMPEAEAQIKRALELDPKSAPALMDLARLQLTLGQKSNAEQNFKQLAAHPGYDYMYGLFLFEEGRQDDAIREFERLAKERPDDRIARTRLVVAYRMANRPADAEKVLQQALKKNEKDSDALLQRAELSLSQGNYPAAELDLNRMLSLMPNASEVHYLLGKLNQARGMSHAYRQELHKALQLKPFLLPVRLELAQSYIDSKDGRTALDLLGETPEIQRNSTPVVEQQNWAYWAMGNMAEMRSGIDLGLSRQKTAELLIQDGLWKLKANNPAEARVSLEQALKISPSDLRALEGLRQSYTAQKNAPMAVQKVKEYATQQPKSARVQDFLGLLMMSQGDRKEARTAFTAASTLDPRLTPAQLSLVQLDVADGKLNDANKRLEDILKTEGDNTTARRWLANVSIMRGDQSAAIQHFRQVLATDPNDAQAANNLAYLTTEYLNDHDTALKLAQKAVELSPSTPEFCDTLGWVLYRKGVYNSAIQYLEKASSSPANVVWKYHLGMAYVKAGEVQRGRTVLNAALKVNANVPEAKDAKELLDQTK